MRVPSMLVVAAICAWTFSLPANAQDFNHDGLSDVVIGVPGEDHGGKVDAGAVDIIYSGGRNALRQHWTLSSPGMPSSPEDGDQFGFATASGMFNADAWIDLAIGIPGKSIFQPRAGAVLIIYGGPNGLVADPQAAGFQVAPRLLLQGWLGVPGTPKYGDNFGFSLAAGWWRGSTSWGYEIKYLAIGAPGVDAGDLGDQGRGEVVVLYLQNETSQLFTQTAGSPEPHDFYGFSLAAAQFTDYVADTADLAIGIPGEDTDGGTNAGAVEVRKYSGDPHPNCHLSPTDVLLLRQSTFEAVTQSDAYFGFSLAVAHVDAGGLGGAPDLIIGEPRHDLPGAANAGVIRVIHGADSYGLLTNSVETWSENDLEPGTAEPGDYFGFSLRGIASNCCSHSYLAVGAPGEDARVGNSTVVDAGVVHIIRGQHGGLTSSGAQRLVSPSQQLRFGWSLGGMTPYTLVVGAPGTANWGGSVVAYPEQPQGGFAFGWIWTQTSVFGGTEVTEADDRFGHNFGKGTRVLWWWPSL
jgi:hypothetical protein